jgi:TonB family protein
MSDQPRNRRAPSASLAQGWLRLGALLMIALLGAPAARAQTEARVAVVDLSGDERGEVAALLRSLARDFALVDEGQTRAAVRGAGYAGSLNLSRDEARALGMSIGCDFYILGKAQVARRIVSAEEFYYDALAGLFIIETRSGRLLRFAFAQARASLETEARAQLAALVTERWPPCAAAIAAARQQRLEEINTAPRPPREVIEVLTDDVAEPGLALPVFYQRLKPAYTEEAGLAGIEATVELEAVFGEDGRVGEIEVVRWAGFGLDEAAVATAKQLRFKPAERDGKKLSMRALVRYNFRRPPSASEREAEAERLKRSLRRIQRPG